MSFGWWLLITIDSFNGAVMLHGEDGKMRSEEMQHTLATHSIGMVKVRNDEAMNLYRILSSSHWGFSIDPEPTGSHISVT